MKSKRLIQFILVLIAFIGIGIFIYKGYQSSSVSKRFDPDAYRYPFFAEIANQLIDRLK